MSRWDALSQPWPVGMMPSSMTMHRLPLASVLLALTTCTRVPATIEIEDPPPTQREPKPEVGPSYPSFDVGAALAGFEEALLMIDWMYQRAHPYEIDYEAMHSYLLDEGLRSLYYFGSANNISLQMVGGLFATSVFVSGPHGEVVDFTASSFGHYNPEFVERVLTTVRALASDRARIERTNAAFDRLLRRRALTYLLVHDALHHDRAWYDELAQDYESSLGSGRRSSKFDSTIMALIEAFTRAGHSFYEIDTAVYFWVRRDIDGTDELWRGAIEALLTAYGVAHADPPYLPRR